MGASAQQLPPKMAAKYAEKARKGEADSETDGTYLFRNQPGNLEVCLVCLDPPTGYCDKQRKA